MIRVSRGPEPEELQRERRQRLAQAILARKAGQPVDFQGYDAAKEAFVKKLNYKCSFCEFSIRREGNPIEHFRPKSRYWWLAWTWENLFFACDRCNTSFKRDQFPLVPGTSPLSELSADLDSEQALLIDPARMDPREHIRFHRREPDGDWIPLPVRGSSRGEATIEALGLHQDEHRTAHIRNFVMLEIDELRERMTSGDATAVKGTWHRTMRKLFAPMQIFHAVTWDVLDAAFPAAERERWGVELPSLGTTPDAHPVAALFVDPPESAPLLAKVAELSEDLAMRVRALGDWTPEDKMLALIREMDALTAWTGDELAALLGRQPSTIRNYRRALKAATAADAAAGQQPPESNGAS